MTMPSGADGLDPGAWMGEWVTQDTFSGLAGRTQDAISSYYQDQVNGSPSWQAATNTFFQSILGGFGDLGQFLELVVEAITGTPGALTDLQTFLTEQWGTLADSFQWLVDLGVLVDTFFKFLAGSKTQANLDAAWLAVCTDFGVTSPDWTGFWDGILANWVTPTGTFSPSTWSKRLTNDLTILFDVFHLTYQAGSVSDPPGHLGSNGKATWYSAWNDLLALVGIVNNTTAPTVTAPTIGESIQANTAAAATAATNASLAISTNQSVIDQVNQAMTGVATPGQPVTSVLPNLTAIPAGNIVGNQGATVAWGATGTTGAAGPGTFSGDNPGTFTHTPAPTDTSVDIIVAYYGASTSTRTATVKYGLTVATLVTHVAGTAYGSNVPELAVYRVALTPTASPATTTISVNVNSTDGTSEWTASSVSYYGIKVNYSAVYNGALAKTNTISMSHASDSNKRLLMAVTNVSNGPFAFSGFNGSTLVNYAPGSGTSLFIGDIAGAASPATTSLSVSDSASLNYAGSWCGVLIEMSN